MTEIRRLALVAGITSILSTTIPVVAVARQAVGAVWADSGTLWIVPFFILDLAKATLLILFYFALYRNRSRITVSPRMAKLCLVSALWLAAVTLLQTLEWLQDPVPSSAVGRFQVAASILENGAVVWLLRAIYRIVEEAPPDDAPVGAVLEVVTRVFVVAWGAWMCLQFVSFWPMFFYVLNLSESLPPDSKGPWIGAARYLGGTLVPQISLGLAPLTVWLDLRRRRNAQRTALEQPN